MLDADTFYFIIFHTDRVQSLIVSGPLDNFRNMEQSQIFMVSDIQY